GDVRFGVERPEEADQTVDRSDRDRLRRRWREGVFRRVIERRAVVAFNGFAQTGIAGRERKAAHNVLVTGRELEVVVNETRLAQRLSVDSMNRISLAPVDVVTRDIGWGGFVHILRGPIPGDLDLCLELFRL